MEKSESVRIKSRPSVTCNSNRVNEFISVTGVQLKKVLIDTEITMTLKISEDPEELKYYWTQWYDKAGTPMRANFDEYVKMQNRIAHLNSKLWISVGCYGA